jgi:hypothetical protein
MAVLRAAAVQEVQLAHVLSNTARMLFFLPGIQAVLTAAQDKRTEKIQS